MLSIGTLLSNIWLYDYKHKTSDNVINKLVFLLLTIVDIWRILAAPFPIFHNAYWHIV